MRPLFLHSVQTGYSYDTVMLLWTWSLSNLIQRSMPMQRRLQKENKTCLTEQTLLVVINGNTFMKQKYFLK